MFSSLYYFHSSYHAFKLCFPVSSCSYITASWAFKFSGPSGEQHARLIITSGSSRFWLMLICFLSVFHCNQGTGPLIALLMAVIIHTPLCPTLRGSVSVCVCVILRGCLMGECSSVEDSSWVIRSVQGGHQP